MQSIKLLLVLAIPFTINGCMIHHIDTHSTVCRDVEARQIHAMIPSEGGKQPIKFLIVPSITNWKYFGDEPISQDAFWVRITAFHHGRKWYNAHHGWTSGDEGIPMLYSTQYAYVENSDGDRVWAEPDIYLVSAVTSAKPDTSIGQGIIDINSDELHRRNRFNSPYGSVYIKFDTKPPQPGSDWIINLGKIKIGDELVNIPAHHLCTVEGSTDITWGVTFRP